MKRRSCIFAILLVVIGSSVHGLEPAATTAATLRLVVIGDSTVCDYPANGPCRGWGQYPQDNFKGSVKVINLARSGRSTKTFIKEGL